MRLLQYPAAIAQAAEAVNALEQRLAELRLELSRIESEADLIVAFETGLKNEDQRKARRFQILQEQPNYQSLQASLVQTGTDRANAGAQLERLRGQFSAAKLEVRLAIAEKLQGLESRELVGI